MIIYREANDALRYFLKAVLLFQASPPAWYEVDGVGFGGSHQLIGIAIRRFPFPAKNSHLAADDGAGSGEHPPPDRLSLSEDPPPSPPEDG